MSDDVKRPELGKLRSIFWPIYQTELRKFLPMGLLLVCILFIYTLCRDLKDTLIQTLATGGGTEMLSALKLCFVLPLSVVFVVLFMKLSDKFSNAQLFYGVITFFVAYFVLFGFVLFPRVDSLHGSLEFIEKTRAKLPWLHWIIPCVTNWTYSLAYIFAELWGSAVISLLFWGFANEITRTNEAPRFYSFFGFLGNIGLLASGKLVQVLSDSAEKKTDIPEMEAFGLNLKWQMFFVLVCGILTIVIYWWMQKNVLTDPNLYTPGVGTKKKKHKMGIGESVKYVCTNPYVLFIALLVLAYGMSINLVEVLWKSQAKQFYTDSNAYSKFMGGVSFRTGWLTMVIMFIGTYTLKNFKWRFAALFTPVFTGVTALILFGVLLYKDKVGDAPVSFGAGLWGASLLPASVWLGMYQVACAKGVKYSLFDATKNMAYLPLSREEKLRSQAAVEVIGSRAGKGSGAMIVSVLTNFIWPGKTVTMQPVMGIVMCLTIGGVLLWILSVVKINPAVISKMEERAREEEDAKARPASKAPAEA
ncbi:MAG: NTP/NDP exchange transporter [Oscillospiraceae bacterium]|jgi:AAA family ATP:ADP antiporter|nr:NTP/NDP exchange transporter [Oscillospiraceae bacterium]